MNDVPEFRPKISLESGMRQVIDLMDKTNKIPNSEHVNYWEDQIIKSKKIGQPLKKINKSFSFKIRKIFSKIRKK